MITGNIKQTEKYKLLHPAFGKVFSLSEAYLSSPPQDGKVVIDGEDLFVIVSTGTGKGVSGNKLEVHRKYIDIHVVLNGNDTIGWIPLISCSKPATEYSEKDDYQLFDDVPATFHQLQKGDFAVCFPEDAHAPGRGEGQYKKLVFKVMLK